MSRETGGWHGEAGSSRQDSGPGGGFYTTKSDAISKPPNWKVADEEDALNATTQAQSPYGSQSLVRNDAPDQYFDTPGTPMDPPQAPFTYPTSRTISSYQLESNRPESHQIQSAEKASSLEWIWDDNYGQYWHYNIDLNGCYVKDALGNYTRVWAPRARPGQQTMKTGYGEKKKDVKWIWDHRYQLHWRYNVDSNGNYVKDARGNYTRIWAPRSGQGTVKAEYSDEKEEESLDDEDDDEDENEEENDDDEEEKESAASTHYNCYTPARFTQTGRSRHISSTPAIQLMSLETPADRKALPHRTVPVFTNPIQSKASSESPTPATSNISTKISSPLAIQLPTISDQPQEALSTSEKRSKRSNDVLDKSDNEQSNELSFSEEIENDSIDDVGIQAMHIVDRLMICVHDMFAQLSISTRGSSSPSTSSKTRANPSGSESQRTPPKKRKRRANEADSGKDLEDSGDDDSTQRPKSKRISKAAEVNLRRLACPYFKTSPRKHHPSRACYGPGWSKVHRIKEHLYREHAMPIHCPRCQVIFKTESELSEHSRSDRICEVQQSLSICGFTKDQEKQLRSRREMFRAASEEEKWKIIYIILFPDTALGEIPCPYYEPGETEQEETHSNLPPQQSGIIQFDAFLRRELPRKVRKAFESKIEAMIGPVEETLRNQLEIIVRDCHEALARPYLESFSVSSDVQKEKDTSTAIFSDCLDQEPADLMQNDVEHSDAFWPFMLPPDSLLDAWPDEIVGLSIDKCPPTTSDSAYYTGSHNASRPQDIEEWLEQDTSAPEAFYDCFLGDNDCLMVDEISKDKAVNNSEQASNDLAGSEVDDQCQVTYERYTGKGKGKAKETVFYEEDV